MWIFFHKLSSPKYFYQLAGKILPWVSACTLILFGVGLVWGLLFAPPDYQQGDAFRIIYIHVPSATMSLAVYTIMTVSAAIFFIWKIKLADVVAKVSAPLGALFTFLALVTGSLWGKPMWGTWWIWDARLTSELLLLFIYLGIISLRSAISDGNMAARACGILILVGFVDIPIIHYSVYWWNTLHQKATILQFGKPTIALSMLYPLLLMLLAFFLYYVALLLMNARSEILHRERRSNWVKELSSLTHFEKGGRDA